MQKTILLIVAIISASCTKLIVNQGFKNYHSAITKTSGYKKANPAQQDLLYLNDLCVNTFPDINHSFPKQKRERMVDSLLHLLSDKPTNWQVLNGYARHYLSNFENQHTNISGLSSTSVAPFILHFVNENWYLWDINDNYDTSLIGKKITKINDRPVAAIEKELFRYVSAENNIIKRQQVSMLINRPDLLKQFGITTQSDSTMLSFEKDKNIWIKTVTNDNDLHYYLGQKRWAPNAVTKYVNHHYNIALPPEQHYAYFQFNRCNDKIDAFESMSEYLKPWAVPFSKIYLNHHIRKGNAQKVRGYVDVSRPVFKDYLRLMFDSIQNQGIDHLIIDLRNNPGGSSLLCLQLLYYLTDREDLKDFRQLYYPSMFHQQTDKKKYKAFIQSHQMNSNITLYDDGYLNCDSLLFEKIENKSSPYYIPKDRKVFKGKIVVLANYGTGSAAALFTTLLQDNHIATIVGTSVGNNAIGATNYQPYQLPNSTFSGSVATGYLIRPDSAKGAIQIPDYWIENSVEDMMQGRDLPFEKALALRQKN